MTFQSSLWNPSVDLSGNEIGIRGASALSAALQIVTVMRRMGAEAAVKKAMMHCFNV